MIHKDSQSIHARKSHATFFFSHFLQRFALSQTLANLAITHTGGGNSTKSLLCAIKTRYKTFGITIWHKTTTQLHKPSIEIYATIGENDFTNIGKYVATNQNIKHEICALISGLDERSKSLVLRQIALSLKAYKTNESKITNLLPSEIAELSKIRAEFFPNIFELGANLYTYNGYLLPKNHFEVSVFWHKHNLDALDSRTLETMKHKDFIDVGGFIGDSAIIFEREFCDKNIYSFEATRANFALMKQTLKLNHSTRIIPINKGLGAVEGTMQICVCSSGSSMVTNHTDKIENAQIITLDSFVCENNIEVGFIKVDIEGFEMEFLKGAKETIKSQKPAMLISIYHFGSDYFKIKPFIESWDLSYKFKIAKGADGHLTGETVLFCEVME